MNFSPKYLKFFEYLVYFLSFSLFLYFFGGTLKYGRTYDDFALVDRFIKSPGDAKLISSFLYAKFHFYPIYFLSHELDNFFTFLLNFLGIEVLNSEIAKFTNMFLHVTNSFLVFILIKKILNINYQINLNIYAYISSLLFLFHPISSQIIFNITTRNESLALFFGLLTFIYCINHFNNRRNINYFFIALLFFFSLCSKLMTIFLAGLIPLTLFLNKFYKLDLKKNFKINFDIFLTLVITFFIYYYLRNIFTEDNDLKFYSNLNDISFYFLTTFKFYFIGLFFPYEHIQVYASNYNIKSSIILLLIFFLLFCLSVYFFIKKKDNLLLISFFWICASLFLPILFGLVELGFPLVSNLAERYQYSSIVSVSIIFMWFLLMFNNHLYKKVFVYSFFIFLISFSILILNDRSKIYVNNIVFMSTIDDNSPRNVHRYAFTPLMNEAIISDDPVSYRYNLYQYYQINTSFPDAILELLRLQFHEKNEKGINYFDKQFRSFYDNDPPEKFKLAQFYSFLKEYDKAELIIKEIFDKYGEITNKYAKQKKGVTFIDPGVDDLHFELGKIYFNLKNYDKALLNFKEANIANPKHATALFNAAITLKKLGLNDEAGKFYADAIKINPFLRETASNLIAEAQNNEK